MLKKNLLKGAAVLTAANLITRFIGFFYRVYMSNTIGTEGMGLYQLIMPVYSLCWSITSSGFTTTISKLTAQEKAKKQYGNMKRLLIQAVLICVFISVILSLALYFFADFLSIHIIKEERTYLSFKILALCFPFMSAGSCIRGYFLGIQNSVIPAASQIIEQCVRVVTVFLLASYFVPMGLVYACAAAICGIVSGEVISFIFVFFSYLKSDKKALLKKKPSISKRTALFTITSMAIPLSASRITSSMLSTVENIMIPQRLQLFGQSAEDSMSIYGKLTGMAMPLIQFPSALLVAVSITLVPVISEAVATNNKRRIKSAVSQSVFYSMLIAVGTAAVFAVFPSEICSIVYNQKDLGIFLFKLSFLCPFLYLHITLSGILNGLGEHMFIFKNSIMSSVINIAFIYFLMPLYGVDAFIAGWFTSLLCTVYSGLKKVLSLTNNRPDSKLWFFYPLLCAFAAGLFVRLLSLHMEKTRLVFLLLILLMMLLYLIFLFILGCIKKNDLLDIAGISHKQRK